MYRTYFILQSKTFGFKYVWWARYTLQYILINYLQVHRVRKQGINKKHIFLKTKQ